MKIRKLIFGGCALMFLAGGLAGCHTVQGVGEDIHAGANAVAQTFS